MPNYDMEDLKLGKALLLAPLVAPIMYMMGVYIFSQSVPSGIKDILSALFFVSAFALPVSYVGTLIIGFPLVIWLKSKGTLTATNLTFGGSIAGGVVFTCFVLLLAGFDLEVLELPQLVWYLAAGGALGAGVSYTFSVISGITHMSPQPVNRHY
ncbi:MAG: hypothetical protein GY746_17410 [Gammaproteobacteria bacterium]|nr:hypothetical protein [Gammaproteobacteria bacterium]